ncbi:MAG: hypothetical protein MJZ38_06840 [archaeon]|nr:hypothetical protein [archaeon]
MALIESTCPHCKEKITVDDERERLFCMYCGASFSLEELTEVHGRMVLQKELERDSAEIDPRAITLTAADTNLRASVYSDGKVIAKIRKGETVIVDITPGVHVFHVRAGLEGSRRSEIDVHEGDRLQVLYHGLKGFEVVRL